MPRPGQVLLIDADDTLWENNIYFERAIERFMGLLAHTGLARSEIRARLNAEERRAIERSGYGLRSFVEALTAVYRDLGGRPVDREARTRIEQLAEEIAGEPIAMLAGAEEALRYLAGRHRLMLFTKGDYAEQTHKIRLSGLAALFETVDVVAEKDVERYRAKLASARAPAGTVWMVGNSPRSDINPALAAGLNAVFVPHPQTWVLEHEPIAVPAGRELIELACISELCLHF